MHDASRVDLGERVRMLRTRRGLTQDELAQKAGISLPVVKKLEQGGTCRMDTLHRLARALDVQTVWFVVPSSPEPREAGVDDAVLADMRSAISPPIGLSGRPLYGTADGDEPDLGRLRDAISSTARKYHADKYDELAAIIPGLIRSAHYHVDAYDGDKRNEALRLRADITGLAGRYLIQVRRHDLALTALQASLRDALEVGDMPLAAAAVAGQGWAMMRQGRFAEVEELAVKTADEVEPRMSTATPDELSSWGYLLLRAAGAAARNNRFDEARQYAQLATTAGSLLPRQYEDLTGHLTWGPVTPALMGPEIEMLDDQPDKVLQLAERIPQDLGPSNASGWHRHRLDVALAHLRLGDADKATEIMHTLRLGNPEWLRYQQYARDITRELLKTRSRTPSRAMADLADFMGVEP